MKSSLAKKASITLPESLEDDLREQAEIERRTLSGIIQEAARFYLAIKKWEAVQRELMPTARKMAIRTEADVNRLVHGSRK